MREIPVLEARAPVFAEYDVVECWYDARKLSYVVVYLAREVQAWSRVKCVCVCD